MEESADSLTRLESIQKHQVNSTGAVISLDFTMPHLGRVMHIPSQAGGEVLSPYVLTWDSQSLPLHHPKSFKKFPDLLFRGRQGTTKKAQEKWKWAIERQINQNKV